MPTTNDLEKLQPIVRMKVIAASDELKNKNIRFYISETYRDQLVQDAYYAQGRQTLDVVNLKRAKAGLKPITSKENENVITRVQISKHTEGRCIDVYPVSPKGIVIWNAAPLFFKPIAEVFKKYGFEWGGDWTKLDSNGKVFKDWPHLEYNGVI